jgi:hypothetical protein
MTFKQAIMNELTELVETNPNRKIGGVPVKQALTHVEEGTPEGVLLIREWEQRTVQHVKSAKLVEPRKPAARQRRSKTPTTAP